jgi:crotonobetainyl-CoA:carnitine CoA-transferase CaiB-like acyl-CoA transferase
MAGLLHGVRVIESAQLLITPQVTQWLADEGADVIKFESPERGDYLRDFLGQVKPHTKGHSPAYLSINKNKRSIAANLKTVEGRQIFDALLATTDVFFDGNAAGAVEKLGLDYESLRAIRPDLIYARLSGFGATGPYAPVPTHGMSMAAVSGNVAWHRTDDGYFDHGPTGARAGESGGGGGFGTFPGVIETAFAIAAALFRRATTGKGAYIDVGVADAGVNPALVPPDRIGADASGFAGAAVGGANPKYNLYETKDGKPLLVALIEHHFYEAFCRGVGREDLLAEEVGFKSRKIGIDWGPESLRDELRDVFLTRTREEWMRFAAEHDVVLAPINGAADLQSDPHLVARDAIITHEHPTAGPLTYRANPIKVAGEQFEVFHHAPALGEDTDDILRELGFGANQIETWRSAGVVAGA